MQAIEPMIMAHIRIHSQRINNISENNSLCIRITRILMTNRNVIRTYLSILLTMYQYLVKKISRQVDMLLQFVNIKR